MSYLFMHNLSGHLSLTMPANMVFDDPDREKFPNVIWRIPAGTVVWPIHAHWTFDTVVVSRGHNTTRPVLCDDNFLHRFRIDHTVNSGHLVFDLGMPVLGGVITRHRRVAEDFLVYEFPSPIHTDDGWSRGFVVEAEYLVAAPELNTDDDELNLEELWNNVNSI